MADDHAAKELASKSEMRHNDKCYDYPWFCSGQMFDVLYLSVTETRGF